MTGKRGALPITQVSTLGDHRWPQCNSTTISNSTAVVPGTVPTPSFPAVPQAFPELSSAMFLSSDPCGDRLVGDTHR